MERVTNKNLFRVSVHIVNGMKMCQTLDQEVTPQN